MIPISSLPQSVQLGRLLASWTEFSRGLKQSPAQNRTGLSHDEMPLPPLKWLQAIHDARYDSQTYL